MKSLIKAMLIIGAVFASTFILLKVLGVLSVEQIENWLTYAQSLSPVYVGSLTVVLLLADIVIAMPTLTVTILSGFFLGAGYGALSAIVGMTLAGVAGYSLGWRYGDVVLNFLIKDEEKVRDAKQAFANNGYGMILLSRAVPILPEVTACLAGATGYEVLSIYFRLADKHFAVLRHCCVLRVYQYHQRPQTRSNNGGHANGNTLVGLGHFQKS